MGLWKTLRSCRNDPGSLCAADFPKRGNLRWEKEGNTLKAVFSKRAL